MKLENFLLYENIYIQCHDNPDADAIASGYGLYCYFKDALKNVRLIYSGRNDIDKPNLKLMITSLGISDVIEFVAYNEVNVNDDDLLITVDCQHGSGNVTLISARNVAIIDHHESNMINNDFVEINPKLGSCATLVWKLLGEANFPITDVKLGTALYYGLYTDTNSFSEISNPYDMDMRDSILFNNSLIQRFKYSILSLNELEIAGIALIKHIYNENNHYAIIKASQCDPNVLGVISDFLIKVDEVLTCVVYNEWPDMFKFSVRSCIKEARADEMAQFIAKGLGNGGGHRDKAGGFIDITKFTNKYQTLHSEAFFSNRINEYFEDCDIVYSGKMEIDTSMMKLYNTKKIILGYVRVIDYVPEDTSITIRSEDGDVDAISSKNLIIILGLSGKIHLIQIENFEEKYEILNERFVDTEYHKSIEYRPIIKNNVTLEQIDIISIANMCAFDGGISVYGKPLEKRIKLFSSLDSEEYVCGNPGDFLITRCDNLKECYVINKTLFLNTYAEI